MSKKKHPEHVNHERWLVSYADFITLLFAFFVVLFASGQSDKKKKAALAEAMVSAFNHTGIFDAHSKTPPIMESSASTQGTPKPVNLPIPGIPSLAKEAEQHIREAIRAQVEAHHLNPSVVTTKATPEGLVISLREAGFFDSGSANVRDDSVELFHAVAQALPHQPMRVEGHTDNVPIHTAQFATNWELSTARAAAITRMLLDEHSVEPAEVAAAGYAEFHPAAGNDTVEGRAANRRVDIILLRPQPPAAATPLPAPKS